MILSFIKKMATFMSEAHRLHGLKSFTITIRFVELHLMVSDIHWLPCLTMEEMKQISKTFNIFWVIKMLQLPWIFTLTLQRKMKNILLTQLTNWIYKKSLFRKNSVKRLFFIIYNADLLPAIIDI